MDKQDFDVVVVGAGACGATLARDLARQGRSVLLLERGSPRKPAAGLLGMLSVVRPLKVGPQLDAITAQGLGGATNLYFGVCKLPTAETQAALGIDLSAELQQVLREIPIAELDDAQLSPQSRLIRESAARLGFPMKSNPLFVDPARCADGRYAADALWNARSLVDEAVAAGATLQCKAQVARIVVEDGRAAGVEYRVGGRTRRANARKVVVSAGSPATPGLLIGAGITDVGSRGFFCKPGFLMFGKVDGLAGREGWLGQLECDLGNGISIGDGAMSLPLYRLMMLSNGRFGRLFSHASTVSVAVALNDSLGGRVLPDGRFEKSLTADEIERLQAAEKTASDILRAAGARAIFRARNGAGPPGGVLWVGEHLDTDLQTRIPDLYVCDQSVVPDVRITPLVALLCLAKRLGVHLAERLGHASAPQAPAHEHSRPQRDTALPA
jgi:hypothetical protein